MTTPTTSSEDPPAPERSTHGEVSRTWELELLISGAVVFALLQLPGEVNQAFDRLFPHLTRSTGVMLVVGYMYVKAILYALITCFLLHLVARAYWVGLIGLDSVFPRGIRWSELRQGPYLARVYRERTPTLPALIVRVDNFCSAMFSFASLIVLVFGVSIVGAFVGMGAVTLASTGALESRFAVLAVLLLVLLAAAPGTVAVIVDRRMGARIDPESPAGRRLARLAAFAYRANGVATFGPILLTLFTNVRKRVMYPLFYAIMGGLLLLVAGETFVRQGILSYAGAEYLPEDGGDFYEDQRPAGEVYGRTPSIQSDVVTGPYVKLFVPYQPERHGRALGRCPGARPLRESGFRYGPPDAEPDTAAVAAVLRCIAGVHRVALNGRPVADLRFDFHTHPRSGVRGVIAHLPTAGLPRGRNVLTVHPAPPTRPRPKPPEPWTIPFWI